LTTKQGIFIDHQAWDLSLTTKHGILPLTTKQGIFIDHQAWDLSLTTKQGIFFDHQAWDLPSSLLLLFKRRLE
jgi:hypothetical protein